MKTVIIGGVAGGASAAARLRRLDEKMEIIILEKGNYVSYANCGLPYHISGVIKDQDDLLLMNPELMHSRYNIDVRVNNEVLSIDTDNKSVTVLNHLDNNQYIETYDYLIIATGSSPIRPDIPGIDSDLIKTIWTVDDTIRIKNHVQDQDVENIVIVGGGFIGLEMAENLKELDKNITIVEASNQVMAPLDYDMALIVHEHLMKKGVNLILNNGVKQFIENNNRIDVTLNDNSIISADLIILSIGVRPNSKVVENTDIKLNQKGGIITDKHMQTNIKDVYAVGDVVEVEDFVLHNKTMIPLAGPANKQGRIAADNIAGIKSEYKGSQGSSIAKIFDLSVASTGANEKTLQRNNINDYKTILISQGSHAGYYPGANPMMIKLIFKNDGSKIYGGQIVGKDGVDKRIDVLATTIRLNGTVEDLKELELAYAPPFSSAKDPINMAGFVADNMISGNVSMCSWDYIENSDATVLDVREEAEIKRVSIPGSINIKLGQLRENIDKLDKEKEYIIMCAAGVRAYNAYRILQQKGFKHLTIYPGGIRYYLLTHPK